MIKVIEKALARWRGLPATPAPLPACRAGDWASLLVLALIAAGLSRRSDGARPMVAISSAALPIIIGVWWCENSPVRDAAHEDRALMVLWSYVAFAFMCAFCRAMFGVQEKVREHDVELVGIDAVSLFMSCAPAGHAAILCLSKGPAVCATAAAAGQAVALLGALAWQLKLSERTRCSALFAGLLCSWGIVGVHSYHGNLCLVACFTAYLARIYELGMRQPGTGSELYAMGRVSLLAATGMLYLIPPGAAT